MKQHDRASARVVPQYEIDTLGAPFKVTLWNCVTLGIDPASGEEKINVPDVVGLINAVVRTRVNHPRKLNGMELKFIRNALGVKAKVLAEFLDMSAEHLSRCEAGGKVMSTSSEKVFRFFAFLGTFFADPEELLVRPLDESEIEKKVTRPDGMGTKLAKHFLSMKIQSAFGVEEELHFEFTREPPNSAGADGPSEDEWRNETKAPIAACG